MAKNNLGLDDDYVENDYSGDGNEGSGFVPVPGGTQQANGRESGDEEEEEEEQEQGGQGGGNNDDTDPNGAGTDDDDEFEGNPHLRGQAEENAGGAEGVTNDPLTNFYAALGLEGGMVDLGDEQVPFNSLDGEQQQLIVTQALEQERQAGRAEALAEELDAHEIEALNVFRQTGQWPSAGTLPDTAQMSADDIHLLDIRRDASLTEEEVQEELDARKLLSTYDKKTANLRTALASEIEQHQADTTVAHQQAYVTELNSAIALLPISPQGERLIDGWGVAAEAIPDLILKVGGDPKKPAEIAPFIQELSNPQVLLKLAFYHYYGKDINDAIDRQIASGTSKPRTTKNGQQGGQQNGQQQGRQPGRHQGPAPETQRQQNNAGTQNKDQFADLDSSFG